MIPLQAIWSKRRNRYKKYLQQIENKHQKRISNMLIMLLVLIVLHSIAMMLFEKLTLGDALWLSLTTVTTVGYGDISASSVAGRLSTSILLYGMGIFLLAQLAAEFFEYKITTREKKRCGMWKWNMIDHLLIVNTPNENTVSYLTQLIKQIRISPELDDIPVQMLTEHFDDGLPTILSNHGVVHHSGIAENNENLEGCNAADARFILVLASDATSATSDSRTLDVLTRLKEMNTRAFVVAEVTQDDNRQRMLNAGVDAVIRPIRAYPEFLIRSLVAPGTEQVLENLFTHEGDRLIRVDIDIHNRRWTDVVCDLMSKAGYLTIAYINREGDIDTNPLPETIISASALICLIKQEENETDSSRINNIF